MTLHGADTEQDYLDTPSNLGGDASGALSEASSYAMSCRSTIASTEDPYYSAPANAYSPATDENGQPGSDRLLWCEFSWLCECDELFSKDNVKGWMHHIIDHHLRGSVPRVAMCWFCNEADWEVAEQSSPKLRRAAFETRLQHIAYHIAGQGYSFNQIRPDYHMWTHLKRLGRISDEQYNSLMTCTEIQPPANYYLVPCSASRPREPTPELPVIAKGGQVVEKRALRKKFKQKAHK